MDRSTLSAHDDDDDEDDDDDDDEDDDGSSEMHAMTASMTASVTHAGSAAAAAAARGGRRASGSSCVMMTSRIATPTTMTITSPTRRVAVVTAAAADGDDAGDAAAFEDKLSALRGKRSKRAAKDGSSASDGEAATPAPAARATQSRAKGVREFTRTDTTDEPDVNWGAETVFYEGPPARGEVVSNVLMSWTLVWLPLTIQAVGRALWLKYKITDKRVSVISESPLRKERTDVPIDQIADVVSVGRGIGQWGDMVITLRNGEKIELRSLPDFKRCEKEIAERMYKEKIIDF